MLIRLPKAPTGSEVMALLLKFLRCIKARLGGDLIIRKSNCKQRGKAAKSIKGIVCDERQLIVRHVPVLRKTLAAMEMVLSSTMYALIYAQSIQVFECSESADFDS